MQLDRALAVRLITTPLVLFLYLALGFFIYGNEEHGENWTAIECIYFCVVSISTVGYGDYSPSTPAMRTVTIFMILVGIVVVFSRLAALIGQLTSPFTASGRRFLEWAFPSTAVDMDGDGSTDYIIPRHPIVYYSKNLLPSALLQISLQLGSAAVYRALEPNWYFVDALYHCVVTASTVGYGDMSIETDGGKMWASIHILFSVAMLGELISTLDELVDQREKQLAKVAQITRKLDAELLEQLVQRAIDIRPKVERDGEGLTELEFVLTMLLELDIVKWDKVRPFIKQFRKLDVDGSGRLGQRDLDLLQSLSPEDLEEMRAKVTQAENEAATAADDQPPPAPADLPKPAAEVPLDAGRDDSRQEVWCSSTCW